MHNLNAVAEDAAGSSRASLHDEILVHLRGYVVGDSLKDGERIPERELCERLGVSRTPLREALKVLASEGLVDLLPNRGARVRTPSNSEVREVFEAMSGLEALAGRLACRRITDEEIETVRGLHMEMYAAYIEQDLPAYARCNKSIHGTILSATRNETLARTHAMLATRVQRTRYHANRTNLRDRWRAAMREHEIILDALQRRDENDLSRILADHLMNKCDSILEERDERMPDMAQAESDRSAETSEWEHPADAP